MTFDSRPDDWDQSKDPPRGGCPACTAPLSDDGACWACDWGPEPAIDSERRAWFERSLANLKAEARAEPRNHAHVLRSIAKSIQPAFPESADLLRGIAATLGP